jgi:hypothetical protein
VVNLITKNSIEEKIMTGLRLKTDLFKGVFDGGEDTIMFSREKRAELLNKLRAMMGEEPVEVTAEPAPQEEIPEDDPHFLNPKVLGGEEKLVAYDEEETPVETEVRKEDAAGVIREAQASNSSSENGYGATGRRSPEKMEEVMNSGMQFLTGLMEMATGQKFETTSDDNRMINIDKDSGEVTLKFKLPGF